MNANINDVAKLAGVSIATVSRVLKDNYPVSDKTKKKVVAAVQELKYTPNFIASSLKSKKMNILGIVLPSLKNNVIMNIAQSINVEAGKCGYTTLFACSENNEDLEKMIINLFRSSFVDAIIAASVMKDANIFEDQTNINIPVVLFDRAVGNIDWVGEDGHSASYEMTQHIIKKGHKRIAFLKGVSDITISVERYEGYVDAMADAGLPAIPELQLGGDFREDKAFDLVKNLLNSMDKKDYPSAIFAANSLMAKGAINAILEHGLSIPSDISIASYGDLDLPKNTRPRITCIRQNEKEMGRLANELVMMRLEEKNTKQKRKDPIRIVVPVTFIEGESIRDFNHSKSARGKLIGRNIKKVDG